jgi:hypothetical protein
MSGKQKTKEFLEYLFFPLKIADVLFSETLSRNRERKMFLVRTKGARNLASNSFHCNSQFTKPHTHTQKSLTQSFFQRRYDWYVTSLFDNMNSTSFCSTKKIF